jgi:hypothetical protein
MYRLYFSSTIVQFTIADTGLHKKFPTPFKDGQYKFLNQIELQLFQHKNLNP